MSGPMVNRSRRCAYVVRPESVPGLCRAALNKTVVSACSALGLLMGDLQPLALPDTLDPLVVDYPARLAQQFGDLAIAIAAVLPGKLDNIGGETPPLLSAPRGLALL